MPGIAMKQKSAGQSASKIFLRCGFMLPYVSTPNGGDQWLAFHGPAITYNDARKSIASRCYALSRCDTGCNSKTRASAAASAIRPAFKANRTASSLRASATLR